MTRKWLLIVRPRELAALIQRWAAMAAGVGGAHEARTHRHVVSEPFWIVTAPLNTQTAFISDDVLGAVPDAQLGQCALHHAPAIMTATSARTMGAHSQ